MVYTVKVEPHPDDEKRYAAEQADRTDQLRIARRQADLSRWLNIISGIGGGIAFFALVALIINASLVHQQIKAAGRANEISKNASDLQNRPYVGIAGLNAVHFWINKSKKAQFGVVPTQNAEAIRFKVFIKNFGPVPGLNYFNTTKVFVGDEVIEKVQGSSNPTTIYPTESLDVVASFGPPHYKMVMGGEKRLAVEVMIEYD
jgi:hypothetical protein